MCDNARTEIFLLTLPYRYLVVTPDVLRVGVDHKIVISVYDVSSDVSVEVSVESESEQSITTAPIVSVSEGKQHSLAISWSRFYVGACYSFAQLELSVRRLFAGGSAEVAIEVTEVAIARLLPTPRYLFIRVKSHSSSFPFNTRKRVVMSLKSLTAFIQTDKPIYVRDDSGMMVNVELMFW